MQGKAVDTLASVEVALFNLINTVQKVLKNGNAR